MSAPDDAVTDEELLQAPLGEALQADHAAEPDEADDIDFDDDADDDGDDDDPADGDDDGDVDAEAADEEDPRERQIRELEWEKAQLRQEIQNRRDVDAGQQPTIDPGIEAALYEASRVYGPAGDAIFEMLQRQLIVNNVQNNEQIDRATFEMQKRLDPLARKYGAQVESLLAGLRAQGRNAPRTTLLTQLVGQEAQEEAAREEERRRKAEQRELRAVRGRRYGGGSYAARRTGTGSTAPGDRDGRRNKDQDAEDEALLRGVTLGDVWNNGL